MRRLLTLVTAATALAWLADRPARPPDPPFRARYISAGGIEVRVALGGAGEPLIVLLHGYAESALAWRTVATGLVTHHRVAALDLPGHGLSGKPASGYSIDAMAGTVATTITTLSEAPVVLVGHSMGGAVAVWVAASRPELVDKLVLIDAAGLPGPVLSSVGVGSAAAWAALFGAGAAVRTPHDPAWLAEDVAARSYEPSADPAYYDALEAVLEEFDFAGLDSILPNVRQPTLVVWGAHDRLTPLENGERFASGIPEATLVVIAGALHRPHTTHPTEVLGLLSRFVGGDGQHTNKTVTQH